MVDTTSQPSVHLADREMRASLGLIRGVCIKFMPGVAQKWDFWVVPLDIDAILGNT